MCGFSLKSNQKKNLSSFLFESKRKEAKEKPLFTGRLPGRGRPMVSTTLEQSNRSNCNILFFFP
jgi:hypothetical protein